MRSGGALLLIVVGLALLWVVITGRLENLVAAWNAVTAETHTPARGGGGGGGASATRPRTDTPRVPVFALDSFVA